MKFSTITKHVLSTGLLVAAGNASAALTGNQTVTLDFANLPAAVYAKPNIADGLAQSCSFPGVSCYSEDGFLVGTVVDPASEGAHLHNGGPNDNTSTFLQTHADAGGIYIRAADFSAFSLVSFFANTEKTRLNPYSGQSSSYYEVFGFRDAINPDVATWDWASDPTYGGKRVAYGTFANADHAVTLTPSDFGSTEGNGFQEISALWIHYVGEPRVPTNPAIRFDLNITNFQLAAPAAVPVPTAVYLFGSGLMGLLALGKRKQAI